MKLFTEAKHELCHMVRLEITLAMLQVALGILQLVQCNVYSVQCTVYSVQYYLLSHSVLLFPSPLVLSMFHWRSSEFFLVIRNVLWMQCTYFFVYMYAFYAGSLRQCVVAKLGISCCVGKKEGSLGAWAAGPPRPAQGFSGASHESLPIFRRPFSGRGLGFRV